MLSQMQPLPQPLLAPLQDPAGRNMRGLQAGPTWPAAPLLLWDGLARHLIQQKGRLDRRFKPQSGLGLGFTEPAQLPSGAQQQLRGWAGPLMLFIHPLQEVPLLQVEPPSHLARSGWGYRSLAFKITGGRGGLLQQHGGFEAWLRPPPSGTSTLPHLEGDTDLGRPALRQSCFGLEPVGTVRSKSVLGDRPGWVPACSAAGRAGTPRPEALPAWVAEPRQVRQLCARQRTVAQPHPGSALQPAGFPQQEMDLSSMMV